MLRSRNPIEGLLKSADRVVQLVAAERLFSWLTRTFTPPAGWLAWAFREDQDPALIRPGQRCVGDGVTEALFIRLAPLECAIEEVNLQSADGHDFSGRLRLPVRVIAEAAELTALRSTLLGANTTLARTDLERYLQWQGRKVLSELAARYPAEELLKPLPAAELRRLVDERLGAACLAAGLTIEGPVTAEFESIDYLNHRRRASDLARRQKEADARSQIQQALAAAQNQRLSHLITMLEQMRETSRQHGERTLMELLQAFEPAERGQMYAALWHLVPTGRRTRWVAAVSGLELLLFDPADLNQPARRHRLPDSLGPLRSVSSDARSHEAGVLLVGAATGVHVVDLESGQPLRTLAAGLLATQAIRGGVNSAAMSDQWIVGAHSELGVMAWPREGQDESAARFLLQEHTRQAQTVRCLRVTDSTAWVAIDERMIRFIPEDPDSIETVIYSGSRSPISALAVTRDALYAGNSEGQILRWPIDDPADMTILRRAGGMPIESIHIVDAGGVEWLVTAEQQDALLTCVLGDTHSCRYQAGPARVRRAAAAEDLFVALNDNRDRLIAWRPDKAAAPAGTVVVPYLTGSSIQDLCLVPA